MNYSFTILFQALETGSGKVYLAEKQNQTTKTKYYAFQFHQQVVSNKYLIQYDYALKQSKYNELFRQFYEIHLGSPQYHLFHYYEEGKFLDQKVIDYGKQKKSFDYAEIKSYLKNLLIALYELHSKQIPGRIFSTYNILLVQERLVLMDFGFGPDIKQDHLDILAPPEYLEQIINHNENQKEFDFKFDSWLLGTILYHLIKFKSINQVEVQKNTYQRFKYDRVDEYYKYLLSLQYIPCQTVRYKSNLLSFVESLLTCNRENRLSFLEIHQHEYIKNLRLENQEEYIQFYTKNKCIKDYETEVMTTEGFAVVISHMSSHQPTISQQGQKESQIIHQQKSPSPKAQNPKIQIIQQISLVQDTQSYPNFLSIIMNIPQFQNSNFNNYWLKIQLDCLKSQLLKQTAEKIKTILPKYQHPYQQVFQYLIKKMNYIVLREMGNDLKSTFFQNKQDSQWETFLNQYEKFLPRSDQISYYSKSLQNDVITLYKNCEVYLKGDSTFLTNSTKQSMEGDRHQNFSMLKNSYVFFQDGYQEELEILLQFINQRVTQNNSEELNQLKQLIFHCLQITTSFQLETFEETFKGLAQNQKVQPKDVAQHLGINN